MSWTTTPPLRKSNTTPNSTPNNTTAGDKGGSREKDVIKKKRVKTQITADILVSPIGVPRIHKQLASIPFKNRTNKENLKELLTLYSLWGREVSPLVPFKEFILKVEKLGGARIVRQMLDFMRKGEEWEPSVFNASNTTAANEEETDAHNPVDENITVNDVINTSDTAIDTSSGQKDVTTDTPSIVMTDEIRDRIARNREAALAKRKQRELIDQPQPPPQQPIKQFNPDEEFELQIEDNEDDVPLTRLSGKQNQSGDNTNNQIANSLQNNTSSTQSPQKSTTTTLQANTNFDEDYSDMVFDMDDDVGRSGSLIDD